MSYCDLVQKMPLQLAERSLASYTFLTERHLQALWHMQRYFRPLFTSCGMPIIIHSPGIWNAEAGPDFLKAHIRIGEKAYYGDIEMHLIDSSWQQHRHHVDPRYSNVILHISFWPSKSFENEVSICAVTGRKIFKTYLEPALNISVERLTQIIDLDLYPYQKFLGSGRCAEALFQQLPKEKIVSFFQDAAEWRLQRKYAHLASHAIETSDMVGSGIALALGYKNNSYPFLELYKEYRAKFLSGELASDSEEWLLSHLLGRCNFFIETHANRWQSSSYYQTLKKLWEKNPQSSAATNLNLNQIRPANHPVRRLAFLAKLCLDAKLPLYWQRILHAWKTSWHKLSISKTQKILRQELMSHLPDYSDIYWQKHFTFEYKIQKTNIAFLGNDLRQSIVLNTFLPILWCEEIQKGTIEEKQAFELFYSSFPEQSSRKSRYLQQRFFGDTEKKELLSKSNLQQGAFQLHHDFCTHYEASCQGCPFVQRFIEAYQK